MEATTYRAIRQIAKALGSSCRQHSSQGKSDLSKLHDGERWDRKEVKNWSCAKEDKCRGKDSRALPAFQAATDVSTQGLGDPMAGSGANALNIGTIGRNTTMAFTFFSLCTASYSCRCGVATTVLWHLDLELFHKGFTCIY